jgi:hypothetical protein
MSRDDISFKGVRSQGHASRSLTTTQAETCGLGHFFTTCIFKLFRFHQYHSSYYLLHLLRCSPKFQRCSTTSAWWPRARRSRFPSTNILIRTSIGIPSPSAAARDQTLKNARHFSSAPHRPTASKAFRASTTRAASAPASLTCPPYERCGQRHSKKKNPITFLDPSSISQPSI